ncbi:MAG: hypothetical protein E6767_13080 [Dysgonomonas sp.]|nr:hypothetical protein [Dysgonomonas sp.]
MGYGDLDMRLVGIFIFLLLVGSFSCTNSASSISALHEESESIVQDSVMIPALNLQIIDTVVEYGPKISPTYKKAVCTELLIPIIEKFHKLNKADKNRIRIITTENIQDLLKKDSPVPKGVYYALLEKGIGEPVDSVQDVMPGDFVQFWTETWGHCGIVKSVDLENNTMDMYSSFPSTDGYGIQRFRITEYCFFVRLRER